VTNDLDLIYQNLDDNGVIVMDDFQYYPAIEVADGVYAWLYTRQHDLAPFCYCTNKLFLCRHAVYEKAYAIASDWAWTDGSPDLPSIQHCRATPRWRTDMNVFNTRIVHLHDIA
jgi:hypothetical protein